MVTAAAIEDVHSRILHGKQLALVIAYAGHLDYVTRLNDTPGPMMSALFVAVDIMTLAP
jgi:hypothetical protein